MAFESGIRTQAAADLAEAGSKVQTSGAKGGNCYGDHYTRSTPSSDAWSASSR
ncbi:hypothetical protein [Billgrantia tianxiuensis]|uniref:hypothetical protein n=1 Tax=Billgrantia tianxiuensis TaxID=2497861 RepID=UPI00135B0F8B|nr:hypothetical protein [Halomonas tianxiuensis]